MPAFQITFKHSAMSSDYEGRAVKFAQTPDEALKCLATKGGKVDKKAGIVIDKHSNTLKIIEINEI